MHDLEVLHHASCAIGLAKGRNGEKKDVQFFQHCKKAERSAAVSALVCMQRALHGYENEGTGIASAKRSRTIRDTSRN